MDNRRISAIIPAFNESDNLGKVLAVVLGVQALTEVIVVDDGSTDGTFEEAQKFLILDPRVQCIRHTCNQGKTQALLTGVKAASGELILFLDADLCRLKPQHILDMILPVQEGRAEMVVGVFGNGKWQTDFSQWLTPWLSGQRCLPRALFLQMPLAGVKGYGIETAFTVMARRQGWRVCWVKLKGVYHPITEARRGLLKGIWTKASMYAQIIHTFWILRDES